MLTDRRQQQAIANILKGFDPGVEYTHLSEPYQDIWDLIDGLDYNDAFQQLVRLDMSDDRLAPLIKRILALEPGHQPAYPSLAEIGPTLPETTWLWHTWLPRGLLTMFAAWPGVGKTYLALDLSNRLISGQPAPDGQPFERRSGTVIWVDAEDFLPELHRRSAAWGMDASKFYPIRRPPRTLLDMSSREHQDLLIDMCYDLRPDLVVVDSLSSVNRNGENNIEDLRDVLLFFTEIPQAFDCALLLIHHPRKPGQNITRPISMHDLRGSGHITAMARLIIGVDVLREGPEENPNGPRLIKPLKNNLTRYSKPIGVQLNPIPGNEDYANITYNNNLSFFDAQPETLTDQCADWLVDQLDPGPQSYTSLKKAAEEAGFKENTLQDARKLLGESVADTLGPKRRGNKWQLVDLSNGEA